MDLRVGFPEPGRTEYDEFVQATKMNEVKRCLQKSRMVARLYQGCYQPDKDGPGHQHSEKLRLTIAFSIDHEGE